MSGALKRVRETYDVKKITYYMYSCDTYCISREMMEMDGLDSAKCQNSEKGDMMEIIKIVNDNKDKR